MHRKKSVPGSFVSVSGDSGSSGDNIEQKLQLGNRGSSDEESPPGLSRAKTQSEDKNSDTMSCPFGTNWTKMQQLKSSLKWADIAIDRFNVNNNDRRKQAVPSTCCDYHQTTHPWNQPLPVSCSVQDSDCSNILTAKSLDVHPMLQKPMVEWFASRASGSRTKQTENRQTYSRSNYTKTNSWN
ncbi:unnamed protein product [Clavelina lepadiformis]|uniref:Uncharacterized protein n=1 Tax=Clavelina lepadiformis TaxID=159417 RepID=A0ABP0GN91_CLALP